MFQQLAIATLPALFSLITGFIVFYGEFRALSERLESIGTRSREYHHVVREGLLEHSEAAAHGTVREDLARLDLRADAHDHRIDGLEDHAKKGERYTEEDARRDLDLIMGLLGDIRREIHELSSRVRELEQMINVHKPRTSMNQFHLFNEQAQAQN